MLINNHIVILRYDYYLWRMKTELLKPIKEKIEQFENGYSLIPEERKHILKQLAAFVKKKRKRVNLLNWILSVRITRAEVISLKSGHRLLLDITE